MPFLADEALRYLVRAKDGGRLPHSYLVTGPDGSGKRDLVRRFFSELNRTLTAEIHPDYHVVEPESKSRRILVEQIRELEDALRMKSSHGGWKFGVIVDADRLMPQASNAFLKTLEEPPTNSILFLLTAVPEALLETVQSRCVRIALRLPAGQVVDPAGDALLTTVARICRERPNTVAGALTLARAFQDQLLNVRAAIESEHEEKLSQETEAYRQRTDGRWLEREGERLLVLTESRYVKARSRLVDRLMDWFAEAVRFKNGAASTSHHAADIQKFAEKYSVAELLRRYRAFVDLQENLSRNIQEALAIEVAFIEAFGPELVERSTRS
jgi:DNA polymerase III subunit delta'